MLKDAEDDLPLLELVLALKPFRQCFVEDSLLRVRLREQGLPAPRLVLQRLHYVMRQFCRELHPDEVLFIQANR